MYQALYRKYRPQTFSEVVGQEHVTETLRGAVVSGRLAHAYLFTGSRGTGKTTCAKILAKAVNCERPVNGNPCNECASCRGVGDGSAMDVIEIDAASNNGVDNIRDLREEANYTPAMLKYRVYIIDEVHMLSAGAFNALLKTLEEPPAHVKFILATTAVHKLPATVLSRCQRFDFRRIAPELIAARLKFVAEKENIDLEDNAALLISRIADGSLRDALSLLDRCASYGTKITEQAAGEAAGIAGREHIFALADAITAHDCPKALLIVNSLYNNSCDMERLLGELLLHYRNMMVSLTVPNFRDLIVCPEQEIEIIRRQGEALSLETVLSSMDKLNDAITELKRGADHRTAAEMAVIRLTNPRLDTDMNTILSRLAEMENRIQNTARPAAPPAASPKAPEPKPQSEPTALPEEQSFAPPGQTDKTFPQWAGVLERLAETVGPLAALLRGSSAVVRGEEILIRSENKMLKQFLNVSDYAERIKKVIAEVSGRNWRLGVWEDERVRPPESDPLKGFLNRARGLGLEQNE